MKHLILSTLLIGLAACGRGTDIAPTLAGEVAGRYQTNSFLDFRCIALPSGSMPSATLKSQSDVTVTLTYQETYPTVKSQTIANIALQRLTDTSIRLINNGNVIGTVRTDRVFSSNGMERQGLVLRVQTDSPGTTVNFTGAKE